MAFHLTPDLDHKFELALLLNQVDEARNISGFSAGPPRRPENLQSTQFRLGNWSRSESINITN